MTTLLEGTLAEPLVNFFYVAWLDFDGDPVRATTFPGGLDIPADETGDGDLDGFQFIHVPGAIVEVSPVALETRGTDVVTVTLSGILGPDDGLIADIADGAAWRGRVARLWHGTHDGTGGSMVIAPYYTGYMMQAEFGGDPSSGGRITITMENYLAILSSPRGRSYQDAAIYDPLDKTAARIRAAANGVKGSAIGAGTGAGGSSGRDVPNLDTVLR